MNPSFYYTYKEDGEKKTNLIWADGLAKKAYHHFGDVLIFDTTYDTNQYHLVFTPFIGVSHHDQTIKISVGFTNKEKNSSFVWLFDKWKEGMLGSLLRIIITD